jgi:hypothetical protein
MVGPYFFIFIGKFVLAMPVTALKIQNGDFQA